MLSLIVKILQNKCNKSSVIKFSIETKKNIVFHTKWSVSDIYYKLKKKLFVLPVFLKF